MSLEGEEEEEEEETLMTLPGAMALRQQQTRCSVLAQVSGLQSSRLKYLPLPASQ